MTVFKPYLKKLRFVWKTLLESKTLFQIVKNSNCCINLLFNARGFNLGHFGIFDIKKFEQQFGHVTQVAPIRT